MMVQKFVRNFSQHSLLQYTEYFLSLFYLRTESPDSILVQPRFCSQNWTCELDKKTSLQCNSQAHHVKQMIIKILECHNLDECYNLKNNRTYIEELILDVSDELIQKQALHEESSMGTDRIKGNSKSNNKNNNMPQTSELMSNDYEEDYDHDEAHHRHELRPTNFDEIESLDNGVTWALKVKFQIKTFQLIMCIAQNEIGDSVVSKIVIPTDLEQGKPYKVSVIKEGAKEFKEGINVMEDDDIVQGDTFQLQFAFNTILFKVEKVNRSKLIN